MKKITVITFAFIVAIVSTAQVFGQCANEINVTSFIYSGTTYEVVLENQTWANAAACAVERGGHLIEINDVDEQNAIFPNLPFMNFNNTSAPDGGGAGYLWIGGNDIATEGNWIWDGNNDAIGTQFWSGDASGTPVGGLYNNWGNEPDNFGSGQDALAYAITNWPMGLQEQWNDVDVNNTLYYIIEYSSAGIGAFNTSKFGAIAPNPANKAIEITMKDLASFTITDLNGMLMESMNNCMDDTYKIDISAYKTGVYLVSLQLSNGQLIHEKLMKI